MLDINSKEFLVKEAHDKMCGCGSGSYRSTCHTRASLEDPVNTAYKHGQISILSQMVRVLNNYAALANSNGMYDEAAAAQRMKEVVVAGLETEGR